MKTIIAPRPEPILGLNAISKLQLRLEPAGSGVSVPNPLVEGGTKILAGVGLGAIAKWGYDLITDDEPPPPRRVKRNRSTTRTVLCRGFKTDGAPCGFRAAARNGGYCRRHTGQRR